MHEYRHKCWSLIKLPLLISILALSQARCKVYTINKSDLETKLKPGENCKHAKGLNSLTTMYTKQYINNVDTLRCSDAVGRVKTKRLRYDSKITIVTRTNKS